MPELNTLRSIVDRWSEYTDRPAVIAFGKRTVDRVSYHELRDRVQALAAGLIHDAGVRPGEQIVIMAPPGPNWVVACMATLAVGAVIVPVDPQHGRETIEHIFSDSEARLLFTTTSVAMRLAEFEIETAPRRLLIDADGQDEQSWRRMFLESDFDAPELSPDDTAVVFYTSGTTGLPKGVPLTHANLVFQFRRFIEMKLVRDDDRLLTPLPFHHVYPFTVGLLTPLTLGVALVIPHALTGPQIQRALRESEATVIIGVPRLYRALVDGIETRARSSGALAGAGFRLACGVSGALNIAFGWRVGRKLLRPLHEEFGPRIRLFASGGSPLDPKLARRLQALGWDVAIGYGLTETAPLLTINIYDEFNPETVGRPIDGVEIRIDETAAPGHENGVDQRPQRSDGYTIGEILARGPNVFKGYRNRPDATGKAFLDDWFRTGDLGYIDRDHHLHLLGRISSIIVTEAGKNVQPDEVEDVYVEHPAIREVGVLQRENRLVALIVPDPGVARNEDPKAIEGTIRRAVDVQSRKLPGYQRVSDFALTRDSLPRTRLGKLQRHKLPERYERAKRGEDESARREAGVMPFEEMSGGDQALLEDSAAREVWEWLARRYSEHWLTPDASLQLDLGVDSMEWLNLTLEIRRRAGVELDETAIGHIENVRDLLREVTEASEASGGEIDPLEHPEAALSDEQRRYLKPLGPAGRVFRRAMITTNALLMRAGFRLRISGAEHIPDRGPLIIAGNHASHLDPFAIAAALGRRRLRDVYWGGFTGAAFSNPITRLGSRLGQVAPIDPSRGAGAALAFGAYVLTNGRQLVWFPEGRRSPSGELLEFRPGIGMLVERFRTPVLPVVIKGSHAAMPVGAIFPKPRPLSIEFGAVLEADELEARGEGDGPRDRIIDALRKRIVEMLNGPQA